LDIRRKKDVPGSRETGRCLSPHRRLSRAPSCEEVAILVRCWIPEDRLREFVEAVVRAAGISRQPPGYRPPFGAIWLDGDRLEDRCWEHIRGALDWTGTLARSWMGFWWECPSGAEEDRRLFPWEWRGVVRYELQRDDGYNGVSVRLEIPPELAESVCRTAIAVGGGAKRQAGTGPSAAADRSGPGR
jgi:hypothetical protein